MKKRTEKGIKKRVFITIGVVLVIVLTAVGYWNINRKTSPAVVEEAKTGEQLEFQDGVMISVDSFRFLTEEEQEQLYKEVGYETIYESKLLEVNLVLESTTTEAKRL